MLFSGKTALLIIDAQNGFLDLAVNSPAVVEEIKAVLAAARDAEIPIIFTQEMHRKEQVDFGRELDGAEAIHCLENSDDVEIVECLRPIDGEFVITKRRYSCFFATDLDLLLRGLRVNTIIVCGFLTDVCVHYTCADAHQYDYHIKVVNDGVGIDHEFQYVHVRDVAQACILACKVNSLDSYVYSITSGTKTSYGELIALVKERYPASEIHVGKGRFSVLDNYATIDISRARAELGYEPAYDIKKGVEFYANWLESHPF